MRFDGKEVPPNSLEEEAWDINHPAKAAFIDDEPDPKEEKGSEWKPAFRRYGFWD